MIRVLKAQSSVQPTQSGEGVALYNLTGNAPSQPMSTRDRELRKKRIKKLVELAGQCDFIEGRRILIRIAMKYQGY